MTWPILIDIHEPSDIILMLKRLLNPVIVQANEPKGLADYVWNNGQLIMIERKTGRELLSTMGSKLDVQLTKYTTQHPGSKVLILQEGIITPSKEGGCYVWQKVNQRNRKDPIHVVSSIVPIPYTAYRAYIFQRFLEGFDLIITEDIADSAITISSLVFNSMKTEHTGLNQYVASKPNRKRIPKILKGKQKYITTLMSITGIGQASAERLMTDHDNLWDIFNLPQNVLQEFYGDRIASAIYKGIGK